MDNNKINSDLLDIKVIDSRRDLDLDFWKIISDLFLKESPKVMDEIKQTFNKKDYTELGAFSHKLKGMSANIGGIKVNELCQEVEEEANSMKENNLNALISDLEETLDKTILELKKL